MEIIEIDDMETLIKEINSADNNYIWRGHADADWKLISTLERDCINENQLKTSENYSLSVFKSKYHIYKSNEHDPKTNLAWISLMQHYGVPTRLLDFTESPYIALYFALENYNPSTKKDLSLYSMNYKKTTEISIKKIKEVNTNFKKEENNDITFEKHIDPFNIDILWVTEPSEMNIRIDRQGGTFLLSGNRRKTVEDIINEGAYKDTNIKKIILNHNLYECIYALLRKANINSKTIYGDLSGLAKYIKMDIKAHL